MTTEVLSAFLNKVKELFPDTTIGISSSNIECRMSTTLNKIASIDMISGSIWIRLDLIEPKNMSKLSAIETKETRFQKLEKE